MKRILATILAVYLLPACALAQVNMTQLEDAASGSTLVAFEIPQESELSDMVRMALDMQIEARFAQKAALSALSRAGVQIRQTGRLYQDEEIASMAHIWQGDQQNGRDGSSAAALTVSLETGMEIYMDELFADFEGAVDAMEAIIEADILDGMNAYMEYADLLPMPTNSYFVDETGLTVFYPEDRYRYFDGESGSVTFYWHEIAAYIGEDSPVYAMSRPQEAGEEALWALCDAGSFGGAADLALGQLLGDVRQAYRLADPDYTTDALVYPLERVRGFAVEIPKYAETEEDETPVSAIRASRISLPGLTTGTTTKAACEAMLGAPQKVIAYEEDAAADAMMAPGESLFYTRGGCVLQLHFDEAGVLTMVILRSAMPESLF